MSSTTTLSTVAAARLPGAARTQPVNPGGLLAAGVLLALGASYLARTVHARQAALFLVGGLAGVVLYHAAFGFTSAWRAFLVERRGAELRAQMLMLAVACALFVPALAWGSALLGEPLRGSAAPLGLAVIAGAFLFGLGMQLGGG